MRRIFSLGLSMICLMTICPALFAQAPPATLNNLMSEVHELRLAIERSTLLGARTQIAIQRLQIQGERVTQAEKQLEEARKGVAGYQVRRQQIAAELKEHESVLQRTTNPDERRALEARVDGLKRALADATGEAPFRARESEMLIQFQNEQATFNRLQSDISQMESLLDRAIQQITGQR